MSFYFLRIRTSLLNKIILTRKWVFSKTARPSQEKMSDDCFLKTCKKKEKDPLNSVFTRQCLQHTKRQAKYIKDFICVSSFCRFRTRQRVYRGRKPPGVGTHRYCRLCIPLKTWRVSVLIEQFSSLLQRERWDNDEMHVEAVTRGQATSIPVTRNLYLSLSSSQPLLYLSRPSSLTVIVIPLPCG